MTIVSASAKCKVMPPIACSRILSEAGLKAWWIGSVKIEQTDELWPAAETKMTWKAGGGLFKSQIITDARPMYIEMAVDTPGADSLIRHTFEELPEGGILYTKSVEPKWRSGLARFMSPAFIFMLRSFVRKEVKKAARFADSG